MKLLIIIAAVVFLAGCASTYAARGQQDIRPHHYGNFRHVEDTPASFICSINDLADLEYGVPNIVRGRLGDDAKIIYQYNGDFSFPTHNRVSLEILEVIRGNLVVGETIAILEPYFIEDRVLFTWTNYLPSLPYHEYFFFLGDPLSELRPSGNPRPETFVGAFFVRNGELGRFRVPESNMARGDTTFNTNELSLGSRADTDQYTNLWQEVINAYMDWSRPPIPAYRIRSGAVGVQHDFDMVID